MVRVRSTDVKPLTPDEIAREEPDVLFLAWLVARATEDLVDRALAPAGLTGDEFAIYSVLGSSATVSPTELARWMAAPATTVSSYVKRFEARGHVAREPHPHDRRSYRLRLTDDGHRAHAAAAALFRPLHDRVLAALGESAPTTTAALHRLRAAVDEARRA